MSRGARRNGDDALVRRAGRRVALVTAVVVGVAMVLVVLFGTLVVIRQQARATDDELRSAAASAEDVDDPPPGTWVLLARGQHVDATSGLPAALQPALARERSRVGSGTTLSTVTLRDGDDARVATRVGDGEVVQVVLDLRSTYDRRAELVGSMAGAAVVGLLLSAGVGVLLGRQAARPLAAALALQRAFVADASHELRTPLTLLSTRAQVLDLAVQASGLPEEVRADSRGVVQDVQRLGDVVEDLLVAADPAADALHRPVDLVGVVDDVVESARAHAERSGVRLEVEDDGAAAYVVVGSSTGLRRALLALVDNAVGHSPSGGTVAVRLARRGARVTVRVSDQGPGIPPGDAERVMRRFSSGGHRAGRPHYGLGLALTSDVANRHGGELRLVEAERGAAFELAMPAQDR